MVAPAREVRLARGKQDARQPGGWQDHAHHLAQAVKLGAADLKRPAGRLMIIQRPGDDGRQILHPQRMEQRVALPREQEDQWDGSPEHRQGPREVILFAEQDPRAEDSVRDARRAQALFRQRLGAQDREGRFAACADVAHVDQVTDAGLRAGLGQRARAFDVRPLQRIRIAGALSAGQVNDAVDPDQGGADAARRVSDASATSTGTPAGNRGLRFAGLRSVRT